MNFEKVTPPFANFEKVTPPFANFKKVTPPLKKKISSEI
jgi:hypothetical protein